VRHSDVGSGRPGLVLKPETAEEVSAAVLYARAQAVPLSVRSGGHGISGRSTNRGGIVIDLGAMNGIEVLDAQNGLVRLGAGARWSEVAAKLGEHGLAMSSGDYGGVGVGGLATAGGLGSGQAESHSRVAEIIERADAKLLAATLNRDLVVPLVMLNRGPREKYPRLKIGRPEAEDIALTVETAAKLAGMGVKIDGEEMRERAGLPAAKSDETALKTPAAAPAENSPENAADDRNAPAPGRKTPKGFLDPLKAPSGQDGGDTPTLQSQTGAQRDGREPDAIALTADEALGDWEAMMEPLLDPVGALIDDCATLGELQSRLAEAMAGTDPGTFTEDLARALFAARVTGLAAPDQAGA